ncbi:hypothetical protein [Pseudomonas syringae group genomosp. 3]|uniref:hypothetical protein n=1 Tax=Pseudomonas syringae group genomosp. 3 TaxID=251701 RepID=UPI0011C472D2|nr:hypothetical protein [Pseudomonas syringae group genomosp. 3]
MIKINRPLTDIPDSIGAVGGKGDSERKRAIKHFSVKPAKKFSFKAYKEVDVVDALELLFEEKCAYCESKILHVAPADIEHFRPKGEVSEVKSHPGYWWLASEWSNLLLSCRDCNGSRYHYVLEDLNGSLQKTRILAGKYCSFPLKGKFRASLSTDNHLLEDPLLIDPTARDPSDHITWSLKYSSALAAPLCSAAVVDEYGYASIKAYALNRQKLVKARLNHADDLKNEIIAIKLLMAELSLKPKTEVIGSVEVLRIMLENLNGKTKPNKIFSSFSKYVIDEALSGLHSQLANLLVTS